MTANPGTEPDDALVETIADAWYGTAPGECRLSNDEQVRARRVLARVRDEIERRGIERAAECLDAPITIVFGPRSQIISKVVGVCQQRIMALPPTDAQPARDAGRVEADRNAAAEAIEDEYALVYGKRMSSENARRFADRAIEALARAEDGR